MLARARGEAPLLPVDGVADLAAAAAGGTTPATTESKKDEMAKKRAAFEAEKARRRQANDHMGKILARTTGTDPSHDHHNNAANGYDLADGNPANNAAAAAAPAPSKVELANQTDANGQRIISLDAVRREIWLENGSIPMKRLMKIFDVKKKASKERRDRFMEVVKELCTIATDPLAGRMLVLKQHYSK
jgi:Ca2+-dependent lipid-binding protein